MVVIKKKLLPAKVHVAANILFVSETWTLALVCQPSATLGSVVKSVDLNQCEDVADEREAQTTLATTADAVQDKISACLIILIISFTIAVCTRSLLLQVLSSLCFRQHFHFALFFVLFFFCFFSVRDFQIIDIRWRGQ